MGDEPDPGQSLLTGGGGEPAVDIAELVHMGILKSYLGQLRRQLRAQQLLLGGGGYGIGAGIGLGVEGDVFQKTV